MLPEDYNNAYLSLQVLTQFSKHLLNMRFLQVTKIMGNKNQLDVCLLDSLCKIPNWKQCRAERL